MYLDDFIIELDKIYNNLVDDLYKFKNDPGKFNEDAPIAYGEHYKGNPKILFEAALFYLVNQARSYLNKFDIISLFYESNFGKFEHRENFEDYLVTKQELDEIIFLEVELNNRLRNNITSIDDLSNIRVRKDRPGPKRYYSCDLNHYEMSKLFWGLAENKLIPGKSENMKMNITQVAEILSFVTHTSLDHCKDQLDQEIGLNLEQKSKIISHLRDVIKSIETL